VPAEKIHTRTECANLAGYVQDSVCVPRVLAQLLNRHGSGQHEQLHLAALGFPLHFVHDGQSARSSTDYQPFAFPWDLFFCRERRVTKRLPEFLGGFLLTQAYPAKF